MRAFCAKVSGRDVDASSFLSSDVTSITGGGAAEAANGLAAADEANGFAGAALFEFEENGFEKGFAGAVELVLFFTPNSDSPILGCGFSSSCLISFSGFALDLVDAPFAMRTPRIPLTLPSFLLHAFRRQLQMYNRRSCPGKWSGRSPLSSRSRLRRPLHTLHLASAPEGAVVSSIQFLVASQSEFSSQHSCTYRRATDVGNRVSCGIFGRIAQQDVGLGVILALIRGLAVVGRHLNNLQALGRSMSIMAGSVRVPKF